MANERKVLKSESLIIRYLSEIIRLEVKNADIGLVSIQACRVTGDLSLARVYVSFFNAAHPHTNLAALNKVKGFIRARLASRIQMRKVPDLEFILDDTLEKSGNLEEIIKKFQ